MSIEEVLAEPDAKSRMIQLCGYLTTMSAREEMPSNSIIKCVEDLIEWARSSDLEPRPPITFREELSSAINRCSMENGSNTPDFILAKFMAGCLASFNTAVVRRADWYGKPLESIGGDSPALVSPTATIPKADEE